MHRQRDLLPGVEGPEPRRVTAADFERDLLAARRRTAAEELLDCAMLILINVMFLMWPHAEIPLLDRQGTLVLLLLVDFGFVAAYVHARFVPRYRARRIATSWSAAERARFRA